MTRKERLERLFAHRETDRPAVYVRTGFPANDASYDRHKRLLAEKTELKLLWDATGLQKRIPGSKKILKPDGDFEIHIDTLRLPAGELTRERFVGKAGSAAQGHDMTKKFFISSVRDAEIYLSAEEPEQTGGFDGYFETEAKLGDAGIVDVGIGNNPAGLVWELCGTELLAYWSADERDLLHELLKIQQRRWMKLCKILIDNKIGKYFSTLGHEGVTPPIHGPADFRDFITRYDQPVMDMLKNAGGRIHVHCHGSIKSVFDEFLKLGVDVLHPFEAPPMGDITAADAKKRAKGRITLEGNIQIADMYEKTTEEIREQVRGLKRDVFYDNEGLIICPTASPYMYNRGGDSYANFEAMVDETIKS